MPVPSGYALDTPTQVKLPPGYTLDGGNASVAAPTPTISAPPTKPQGFLSSALDSSGLSSVGNALLHPIKTIAPVAGLLNDAVHLRPASDTNPLVQGIQNLVHGSAGEGQAAIDAARQGSYGAAASHALLALPGVGSTLQKAMDQAPSDSGQSYGANLKRLVTNPGAMGTIVGAAASPVVAEGISKLPSIAGNVVRSPFVGSLDETIPGTSITPRQRYAAAQRLGVNLDLADATNAPLANSAKAIGRNSLAGEGVYEKAKAANIGALGSSTDRILSDMSPLDRESGGVQLQNLLKANQEGLKNTSDSLYGQVDSQYGNTPISNPATVSGTAKRLLDSSAQHREEFPSLVPRQSTSVLEDASRFGVAPQSKPIVSPLVDEYGKPMVSSVQPPAPTPPSVSDALKARSGILDLYRSNPDLVKTASDAQLQQLVGATHDAVMDSLPTSAQENLRNAQLTFKELKGTYDNPSSPYYDAVRTPNPSLKVQGIGPKTPEMVRDVLKRIGPEGQGILQRGESERMLGTAPGSEEYNFRSFPTQFSRLPSDYGRELFGNRLSQLKDISDTSSALSKDLNPSGTAKQGQKFAEAVGLLKTGGIPLLQYPLAKAIASPNVVNFMMRGSTPSAASNLLRLPLATAPLLKNGTR